MHNKYTRDRFKSFNIFWTLALTETGFHTGFNGLQRSVWRYSDLQRCSRRKVLLFCLTPHLCFLRLLWNFPSSSYPLQKTPLLNAKDQQEYLLANWFFYRPPQGGKKTDVDLLGSVASVHHWFTLLSYTSGLTKCFLSVQFVPKILV